MMKVLMINNDGGGFAKHVELADGMTVGELFAQHLGENARPESYLIRVNRLQLLVRSLNHLANPSQASIVLQCTAVIEMEDDPVPLPELSDDNTEESSTVNEFATASLPEPAATTTDKPNKPR